MARPAAAGLSYFPLDTHLDFKAKMLRREFGAVGIGILTYLLMLIYGERGYYAEWNDDVALSFAEELHVGCMAVSEVVSACIRRGIFDREKFEQHSILTSAEIQRSYLEAKKRSNLEIDARFAVDKCAQTSFCSNKEGLCSIKEGLCNINSRDKIKENKINRPPFGRSKEKERRGEFERGGEPTDRPTDDEVEKYGNEIGAEESSVRAYVETMTRSGWRDAQGRPVMDWRTMLRKWTETRRSPKKEASADEGAEYYERLRACLEGGEDEETGHARKGL